MKYWNKFNADDFAYLMEHEKGLICWQTDYKLLRLLRLEIYLAETEDYQRDIIEHNTQNKMKEQIPLFPEKT